LTQDLGTSAKSPLRHGHFIKAYASFVVCAVVVFFSIAAIVGGILGGVWGMNRSSGMSFTIVVLVSVHIVGLVANYFVFRFLIKRFIVSALRGESAA
jgi:hypothetical protein